MARWGGPYPPKAWNADGDEVEWDDRTAAKRLVRWRINGSTRQRQFDGPGTKGRADTFVSLITLAREKDWDADDRGRPLDPAKSAAAERAAARQVSGDDFASFADSLYEARLAGWDDKTREFYALNLEAAKRWIVYPPGDERLATAARSAGDSILLAHLDASDLRRALEERRSTNYRTRAQNERAQAKWLVACEKERRRAERQGVAPHYPAEPIPRDETVKARTVNAFGVSLGMVLGTAWKEQRLPYDVWDVVDVETAPDPKISRRLVPSIDEVWDLADAIAAQRDGRGERFRALVLVNGTTGPRPGEAVAAAPADLDLDVTGEETITYLQTEGAVSSKHSRSGQARTRRGLKHRREGEERPVPMLTEVADAVTTHLSAGYGTEERVWTGPEGGPLTWGNISDTYWRPACQAVFAGSAKPHLANAAPGILRKAAITWWLTSGNDPYLAAQWAGNSPEVIMSNYAGVIDHTYETARAKLATHSARR